MFAATYFSFGFFLFFSFMFVTFLSHFFIFFFAKDDSGICE